MDKLNLLIFEKICSLTKHGKYIIVADDDLLECLPDDVEQNEKTLSTCLFALAEEGYIDVKYRSGEMYCLAPIKEIEPAEEPPKENDIFEGEIKSDIDYTPKFNSSAFWGAVCGGLLSGIIIALVVAFL